MKSSKECIECLKVKPIEEFYKRTQSKDGYNNSCKKCRGAYEKQWKLDNLGQIMFTQAKSRSKRIGRECTIELEDIVVPDVCPLLGIPLSNIEGNSSRHNSASLDRIDPSKGYVKGNVWVISGRANLIKTDAHLDELELLVKNMRTLQDAGTIDSGHRDQRPQPIEDMDSGDDEPEDTGDPQLRLPL